MRKLLRILHRWTGLVVALAVVITGLTGAVIPYQDQIRSLVAGEVWDAAPPEPGARVLSGLELKRIAEEETGGSVSFIKLVPDPDHAQSVFVSAPRGEPPLPFQQYFLDPYTGEIRARVNFADLADGPINIAPFLVAVHYSLAAGQTGRLLLGWAALAWLLLSFTGVVLTFPRKGCKDVLAGLVRCVVPAPKGIAQGPPIRLPPRDGPVALAVYPCVRLVGGRLQSRCRSRSGAADAWGRGAVHTG